ncbi:P-loop containing nucleoside triphosphate hydrolase protein [Phaeosphaeriaceae sp. PMI808]|nr:P-loop containing nucleoside triphosphate hydrolase protein [Phaeosphaeriaceae sp. PMI808]
MTGQNFNIQSHEDLTSREYFHHSSAQRINTDAVLAEAIRKQYPNLELVIVPKDITDLLAYASAGFAKATPLEDAVKDPVYSVGLKWRYYLPPFSRLDNRPGAFVENVVFGKYLYKWNDLEIILYIANGRDGSSAYPTISNQYILTTNEHKVDELIKLAATWGVRLHNEVWVFDQGFWQKSAELYQSVQKASWDAVILDEDMKKALIADVENFFDGQNTYQNLKVPWKRGIIYYGPPGNGKTISIKAMMHSLYQRGVEEGDKRLTVPTLYVRTLSSFAGPEYSLRQIFSKARQEAPCYLVFEDLDSIVSDNVRSYFLNEVDGLKSNDGILMVGSTNHLDRLDPGISKRPSRFDRKYYFSDPNYDQRVQYAEFWQQKLQDNKDVDFPDKLCQKIADITDKFSFAYMQEAFVASLLAIASRGGSGALANQSHPWAGPHDPLSQVDGPDSTILEYLMMKRAREDPDLEHLELWIEIQKQVKILKDEMEEKRIADEVQSRSKVGVEMPSRSRVGVEGLTRYKDELDVLLHGGQMKEDVDPEQVRRLASRFF